MSFREDEGLTVITTRQAVQQHGLKHTFFCRMITVKVHSSLEAVGFMAVMTKALAEKGIGVNPVSGFFHDHMFVPEGKEGEAMEQSLHPSPLSIDLVRNVQQTVEEVMAENPKLRAWRIKVIAEKNKLANFPEVLTQTYLEDSTTIDSNIATLSTRPVSPGCARYQKNTPGAQTATRNPHGPIFDNFRIFCGNGFLLRTKPLGLHTRDFLTASKPGVVTRWKKRLKRDRRRRSSSSTDWLPPRGLHPCRKIVFEILSHQEAVDFSEPQYGDSPTWFDVSVEKVVPQDDVVGPSIWTPSMNEEWGDEFLACTNARLQVLKKVPGVAVESRAKVAVPASTHVEEHPTQLFQTTRTKPSLAATTRQTVVQQNYQGDAIHRSHVITWRYDDDMDMDSTKGDEVLEQTGSHSNADFVRQLERGESIILWARARNRPRNISTPTSGTDPCINVVDRVRVHVFWAV
ncbi:MAG: hypothetical protein LQ351_004227 [Letrouitia transgressa]|nr:MAG: hypothetical protein LQ351_004227 [Letrouitia transgressa]